MKYLGDPSSGSYAGITASRNRNGQYKRTRAIPVNPSTAFQNTQRANMAARAAEWRTLTAIQRAGWTTLGLSMTRTDSLGQTQTFTGFQAYCSVNQNREYVGDSILSNAPGLTTPSALVIGAVTLTNAAFTIAYTVTPLPAGARCITQVSEQVSAGRKFSGNMMTLQSSAAAAASPVNAFAAYQARFGTPVVGNRIFYALKCYDAGFHSVQAVGSSIVT